MVVEQINTGKCEKENRVDAKTLNINEPDTRRQFKGCRRKI